MKKVLIILVLIEAVAIGFLLTKQPEENMSKPRISPTNKPLLQYTYNNLRAYKAIGSDIQIDKEIRRGDGFISYLFFFSISSGKKVSGLINIPNTSGNFPVILLIRGFVDPAIYETGVGSQRVGEYFASKGFITVSPDFLGYGQSDNPSLDALEDRFQTYTTVIDLLASVKNLNTALTRKGIKNITSNTIKGIWAHSNGGQIALSVAEITGFSCPLVLWAPVSKPFPYSILYYTDEFDDKGKALRKILAQFEQNYNAEDYSLTNYFDWIKAPIQLHQGINDEAVPLVWSNTLKNVLIEKDKTVEYFTYPGENHNFQNGGWQKAVERSLDFVKTVTCL